MDRCGFLLFLAGLPSIPGLVREVAPVAAEPVIEAVPEIVPAFAVTDATTIFPFYWSSEITAGILVVPLLDQLIAEARP